MGTLDRIVFRRKGGKAGRRCRNAMW